MLTKRIIVDEAAAVYHCIGRIVGGEMVLGDEEKERFRRLMWQLAEFSGVEIITYCLMSNHVHLLVRVPAEIELSDAELCRRVVRYYGRKETWVQVIEAEVMRTGSMLPSVRERLLGRMGDVSFFMRTLKQRFSRWYNKRHNRFGTLWAERFKSVLVEDVSEALRTVAMYIDLNPVRAGLVQDPKDYRFCGYAEALAGNRVLRQGLAGLCEARTWRGASAEYRSVMMIYAGEPRADKVALSREQILKVLERGGRLELAELLRLRLRYLTDGVVFGSREFVDEVFEKFRDRFGERRRSGARSLSAVGGNLPGLTAVRDLRRDAVG